MIPVSLLSIRLFLRACFVELAVITTSCWNSEGGFFFGGESWVGWLFIVMSLLGVWLIGAGLGGREVGGRGGMNRWMDILRLVVRGR